MPPFAPRPVLRSAGTHTVRRGDSPVSIATLYRQPASSYRDLVAANPHKAYTLNGIPSGSSMTFASLQEGERLRLPWFWFAGKNEQARGLLADGMVGDIQQDAISHAVFNILSPLATTPEAKAALPAAINAVGLWYRQDHPAGGVPTAADLKPYSASFLSWWQTIGSKLPADVAASIPWNEPWIYEVIRLRKNGLDLGNVNWGLVNSALEANVKPGMFPVDDPGIPYAQGVLFGGTVPNTTTNFTALPWSVASLVRWDLLPIHDIALGQIPKGASGDVQTQWLISQIKQAAAKKAGTQGGSAEPTPGGGTTPPLPPPDCSKSGAGAYPQQLPNGQYTGQCVTCGANAFMDTDKLCTCLPGFKIDPQHPDSGDCIADTGAVDQNKAMCPNGGTLFYTQGDPGIPACKCPDGTVTPTGPTGGCGTQGTTPAKADDSTSTPLLIAGGVVLGAMALYFANRK